MRVIKRGWLIELRSHVASKIPARAMFCYFYNTKPYKRSFLSEHSLKNIFRISFIPSAPVTKRDFIISTSVSQNWIVVKSRETEKTRNLHQVEKINENTLYEYIAKAG